MRYLTGLVIMTMLFGGCTAEEEPVKTDQEIREEFTELFHEFYEVYGSSSADFVDYYAEDFINMDNAGNVTRGASDYKATWEENFEINRIDSLYYGDPEIVFSREMIVTYNDYWERFVNKETGESREVSGTWIAAWKPIDGEWKVVMTTYHSP